MLIEKYQRSKLTAVPSAQRNLFRSETRAFYRGVGFLTPAQVANPTYRERIRQRSAPKTSQALQTTPRNEYVVQSKNRGKKAQTQVKSVTFNRTREKTAERKRRETKEDRERQSVLETVRDLTKDIRPTAQDQISAGSSRHPTADGTPEQVLNDALSADDPNTSNADDNDGGDNDGDDEEIIIEGFEDDDIAEWRSDTIPIRCVIINRNKHAMEESLSIPYTPIFNNNLEKLNDPSATTSMASVTRSGTTRDAPSMMSLTKFLRTSTTSVLDVGPLVRLGCIIMSFATENYKTEIIPHRVIRGWETTQYIGMEIGQPRPGQLDGYHITAMPIDVFNSFTFEKCNHAIRNEEHEELFFPDESDNSWVAIPIKQEQLKDVSVIPYIASFLTSDLFTGRVNHVFKGRYVDTNAVYGAKTMALRIMPCVNSVSIPGPKMAILVLIDCTSTSHPNTVTFGNHTGLT